jgi:TusA-related sulfurtransferase
VELIPDGVCDGGDLDCGSGLLLIIKKSMNPLTSGQILEIRSRERSVAEDLPAWCRMVEHEFMGSLPGDNGYSSYFVRKGGSNSDSLEDDLRAAKGYKWAVRVQGEDGLTAKVHARNHTFKVGQPADFSAKVDAPSAVDYLIGAVAADLLVGFKALASRAGITIDDVELSLKGALDNVLYHLGLEEQGTPAVAAISGTLFVTSPDEEGRLQEIWRFTLQRSPLYQTLKANVELDLKLAIVL